MVPTYNRAAVVERAISSVIAQTTSDWELVVVDDASSDDTASTVARVHDRRVRIVRREVNGGVAAAQNTGLAHAAGRFVAFLHSDDEFLPARLATLVPVLDAAPAAAGVESGFEQREAGQVHVRPPYLDGASSDDLLAYRAGVHIATLLVRREHALAVGFDERLRGTEDRDFCIRLLRRAPVVSCALPLVRINLEPARLGTQPKGAIYRYLLAKYADEIVRAPDLHGAWWFRIARAYARSGDFRLARDAMRRAVRVHPWRVRRWPLGAAALVSDQAFDRALATYLALAHTRRPQRKVGRAWRNVQRLPSRSSTT